jgi:ribosomal-protein-alanine N-acetyltransferase
MSHVRIRPATREDLTAILALEQQCAEAPHWGRDLWHDVLQSTGTGSRCALIAEAEGALAGFVVVQLVIDQAEIESLAVDALYRRQGLGTALCRSAAMWAAEQGARALYERAEYMEIGYRARYYSDPVEDAILMELRLQGE